MHSGRRPKSVPLSFETNVDEDEIPMFADSLLHLNSLVVAACAKLVGVVCYSWEMIPISSSFLPLKPIDVDLAGCHSRAPPRFLWRVSNHLRAGPIPARASSTSSPTDFCLCRIFQGNFEVP